jgi:hypothetical protein
MPDDLDGGLNSSSSSGGVSGSAIGVGADGGSSNSGSALGGAVSGDNSGREVDPNYVSPGGDGGVQGTGSSASSGSSNSSNSAEEQARLAAQEHQAWIQKQAAQFNQDIAQTQLDAEIGLPDYKLINLQQSDPNARKLMWAYETRPDLVKGVMKAADSYDMGAKTMFANWKWNETANGSFKAFVLAVMNNTQALFQEAETDPCAQYPGWVSDPAFPGICRHMSGRTLVSPDTIFTVDALELWWNDLNEYEQLIEYALADTAGSASAAFDHIPSHTFEYVTGWIEENRASIEEIAERFDVDPVLVAGILASEMLYDYSEWDARLDSIGIGEGQGYANVHPSTFFLAYNYLAQIYHSNWQENPWLSDPLAPQVQFELLEENLRLGGYDPISDMAWHAAPIAGVSAITNYQTVQGLGNYARTDEGAITLAALTSRWLSDAYVLNHVDRHNSRHNLTPEDMSVIFSAYRGGIEGVSPPADGYSFSSLADFQHWLENNPGQIGDNMSLALPLMIYFDQSFEGI